jgi:hypothetical protein
MKKTAEDNPESGRTRRYTGKLASPIRIPAPPTFSGAVTSKRVKEFRETSARYQTQTDAAVSEQKEEKIRFLLQHYGIADRDMQARGQSHNPVMRIQIEPHVDRSGTVKRDPRQ